MKKKIDPDHYITDALITSDEWDARDYDIKAEIEGMAKVGDNDNPKVWEETFAATYLRHAEELLIEKHKLGNHVSENIRELQTLIKKYDHLKTFLLALRIATITYRAGLIPEFITKGNTFKKGQSVKATRPRSHAGKTPPELQDRNQKIIEHFQKKKTGLTPSGFAERHAAEYGLKPRRIREILKMALGT